MTRPRTVWILVGLALWWGQGGVAHAYLDPGAGSLLMQVLVGGLAGGLFLCKAYWARVKAFLTPGRTKGDRKGGTP